MGAVIVSGALANKPFNGGNAWSRLSWILGFKRLGFDVLFIEQIGAQACVDADGVGTQFGDSVNLAYFKAVMKQFALEDCSALICDEGAELCGVALRDLARRAQTADLLFNLSGHLALPELKNPARLKVYYDDDPGFTQFWHIAGKGGARLEDHDFYFTIGENIGAHDCAIPTGAIRWRHTRPPVVLTEWPVLPPPPQHLRARFTTVASWRGAYGPVYFGGKSYGLKVHEFRKFIELPQRADKHFEIALQIHPGDSKDLEALLAHGWRIVDPRQAAASPDDFRNYVQSSGAEFSAAQGIYVDTFSGWFSDRTTRYLASGKPALVQETGFSRNIPAGTGLVSFRTLEDAITGAERIVRDYETHSRAARRIAEDYFDSDKIIGRLAAEIGLAKP